MRKYFSLTLSKWRIIIILSIYLCSFVILNILICWLPIRICQTKKDTSKKCKQDDEKDFLEIVDPVRSPALKIIRTLTLVHHNILYLQVCHSIYGNLILTYLLAWNNGSDRNPWKGMGNKNHYFALKFKTYFYLLHR